MEGWLAVAVESSVWVPSLVEGVALLALLLACRVAASSRGDVVALLAHHLLPSRAAAVAWLGLADAS
jgi:hypothetical protein